VDVRCHENKDTARAESVYISTSLGLGQVCCSEPRFPGLGQDKPRPFPTNPAPFAFEKAVFSPLLGQNFRQFVIFREGGGGRSLPPAPRRFPPLKGRKGCFGFELLTFKEEISSISYVLLRFPRFQSNSLSKHAVMV
jgi:hypothetical protein